MVDEAMILVSGYYYNKIDALASVHLFFDLYSNNFRKYQVDEEHLRFFAFFVRNNPLFLDKTGLYSLCRKVVDLYEQDEVKFQNKVQLDTGNKITLKDWMKKVRSPLQDN